MHWQLCVRVYKDLCGEWVGMWALSIVTYSIELEQNVVKKKMNLGASSPPTSFQAIWSRFTQINLDFEKWT